MNNYVRLSDEYEKIIRSSRLTQKELDSLRIAEEIIDEAGKIITACEPYLAEMHRIEKALKQTTITTSDSARIFM
jgi:hypothetical protein